MLTAIENDRLSWDCLLYDEEGDLVSCGQAKRAHVEDVVYLSPTQSRGDVMALPRCQCGAQTFLKADYTLKDLWKNTYSVMHEGEIWAYVLSPKHARNLWAHWLLYERGLAPVEPALALPPNGALVNNPDLTYALWFGFQTVRQYLRSIGAGHLLGKLPTAPLLEKGGL